MHLPVFVATARTNMTNEHMTMLHRIKEEST